MKTYEIIPGSLYQRGRFAHLPQRDKAETIQRLNIGLVINLTPDYDDDVWWHTEYLHLHIPDNSQFREDLPRIFGAVDQAVAVMNAGGAVLTHCHAGRNRASLVNALIVREYCNYTGSQALELVRRRRPGSTLGNKFMERYLEELDAPYPV